MQFCLLVGELLELEACGLKTLLRAHELGFRLGFGLGLVNHVLALSLDGGVRLLDELLICLLRLVLRTDCGGLHLLGVADNLLEHAHDVAALFILAVFIEAGGRGRRVPSNLFEGGRRCVAIEIPEDLEGRGQEPRSLPLVRDGQLKLVVLFLAVFPRPLQLHLHLCDLGLQRIDGLGVRLHRAFKVGDLRLEVVLLPQSLLRFQLVGVKLLDTKILVLDLGLLVLQMLGDEFIDGLLHPLEGVQARTICQRGQARAVVPLSRLRQEVGSRGTAPGDDRHRHAGLNQRWVEGPAEQIMGVVPAENGHRLGNGLHLLLPHFLALLPLLVRHGALLFQHLEKLFVDGQAPLRVIKVCL
mmetsp:Transcript_104270/g.204535  ORF Transcript_104270/g.204535 Transcript_104270/m.204535 type:complete len:356 (+) Transcript_104270:215-1282(+)